jgi:translation initiation factor IF-1
MFKHKSTKTQPQADGHDEAKTATAKPRSNGHAHRSAAPSRSSKAPAQLQEHDTESFQGILEEFNFGAKGGIEGFLLHSDGQTVQVNVTPDVGFAVVRGIGQQVEAKVEPEPAFARRAKGDHPVYRLVTLIGPDGKTLIHSSAGTLDMVTVQGTVKRINFARDGAPNGVILESGEFIYLKPEGMKRMELKQGDQVTVEGTAATMPLGQQVIEAKTVNGNAVMGRTRGRATSHRSRS